MIQKFEKNSKRKFLEFFIESGFSVKNVPKAVEGPTGLTGAVGAVNPQVGGGGGGAALYWNAEGGGAALGATGS